MFIQRIRLLLLIEAALFAVAALVHSGALISGYEHTLMRIFDAVMALVLVTGAVVSLARPQWTRRAGLIAQGIALLGTFASLVALVTRIIPQTMLEYFFHAVIEPILGGGLIIAYQSKRPQRSDGWFVFGRQGGE